MALIAALLATLAAGLFTGAAVYITFVEHPARVSCGSALAVTEFGPSYKRATVMQASLALVGASAGIGRWAMGGGLFDRAGCHNVQSRTFALSPLYCRLPQRMPRPIQIRFSRRTFLIRGDVQHTKTKARPGRPRLLCT